nr:unnamed protein product [Spirometra erinaceieuropaei]
MTAFFTLRLPLRRAKSADIVGVNAPPPPITRPYETKTKSYEGLHILQATVPKVDKLIALDDFNGLFGANYAAWRGVLGSHGISDCNNNELLRLQTCTDHYAQITNTFSTFLRMLSTTLIDAYGDERPGIRIACKTGGHLLNSRHRQAPTRLYTITAPPPDLLFSEDRAHNTATETDMNLFTSG